MHSVFWLIPDNPEEFVKSVLSREADDIPEEKISQGRWVLEEILFSEITVNRELITAHDKDPLHIKRRDNFITAIKKGEAIVPLIVLGKELFLVDGYARYRALKQLGVQSAEVVLQKFD